MIQLVEASKWGRERTFKVSYDGENSWRAQDLANDTHAGVGTSMEDAIEDCWARIEPNLFS